MDITYSYVIVYVTSTRATSTRGRLPLFAYAFFIDYYSHILHLFNLHWVYFVVLILDWVELNNDY